MDFKLGAGNEYICFDEGSSKKSMEIFHDICHSGGEGDGNRKWQ